VIPAVLDPSVPPTAPNHMQRRRTPPAYERLPMNTTRALALPAIAMMAATLLAGCGNTKASSSSDPKTSQDAMMTESAMATPDAMMSEDAMATESAMMSEDAKG